MCVGGMLAFSCIFSTIKVHDGVRSHQECAWLGGSWFLGTVRYWQYSGEGSPAENCGIHQPRNDQHLITP